MTVKQEATVSLSFVPHAWSMTLVRLLDNVRRAPKFNGQVFCYVGHKHDLPSPDLR